MISKQKWAKYKKKLRWNALNNDFTSAALSNDAQTTWMHFPFKMHSTENKTQKSFSWFILEIELKLICFQWIIFFFDQQ